MSNISSCLTIVATTVSAIATIISALAAWRMWKVSKSTLDLQASVENAKKPLIHIWFNGEEIQAPVKVFSLSLVNLGQTSMPIRKIRVLNSSGVTQFQFLEKNSKQKYVEKYQAIMKNLSSYQNEVVDLILLPSIIYQLMVRVQGQFKIEAMYYDNSFEFIEIDTSYLGGKYILTGQGRKC